MYLLLVIMRLSFFKKTFKSIVIVFLSLLVFLESINIFFKCSFELFLNFHFKNCWLPWGCNCNKNSRFKSSQSSCKVSNANAKFQFIFKNTTGNFSFETYRQLILHFFMIHTPAHVI